MDDEEVDEVDDAGDLAAIAEHQGFVAGRAVRRRSSGRQGCARCHDHKFDPVPTEDYYSLFGIFASSTEPEELPIIGSPKEAAAYAEFQKELAIREKAVTDYEAESLAKVMDELRSRSGDCLLVIARDNQNWLKLPAVFAGKNEPRRQLVDRWKGYLERTAKEEHRVFAPWHQLSKVLPDDFPAHVTKLIDRWKSAQQMIKNEIPECVVKLGLDGLSLSPENLVETLTKKILGSTPPRSTLQTLTVMSAGGRRNSVPLPSDLVDERALLIAEILALSPQFQVKSHDEA